MRRDYVTHGRDELIGKNGVAGGWDNYGLAESGPATNCASPSPTPSSRLPQVPQGLPSAFITCPARVDTV